ncbi:ABC-2 type transport system ATP-binding protein [Gracilibacillus ureilyticus]|uniref:ABC-2 type transport system ATP-binding protein n=1 Tax=Gracilibacillus ureilyticus TaxID=531814 RepID=A0A1H9QAC6_9BACI|nr:ABC transporter ATP-binding protein [Gracilibacillus ureilyticus]SER57115.1 ABC-2 type transport system ATP-binding protein [Gracilibacillus ureilyticus]
MSIVNMNAVSKKFGSFVALNNIDLQLNKGEVFGFIGPNGAGKSTTIRILLGILQPTSGHAAIFGKDVWKEAVAIHEKVAYVPGDVNLWGNLTGGEVIDIFLGLKGKIDKRKRDMFIDRFQLDIKKKCGSYSKGNRQKIALIAAFASNADLYILDEPTSGLDPLMEQVFQQCVEEVKNAGKTVLLSSHILSEVEKLCDRVGIIRKGEIIETGSIDELRHLTRMNLVIATTSPILDLEKWEGVHDVQQSEESYRFQVDADKLTEIMKKLSSYGIERLESKPPTLEDLFMRHYQE